MAPPFSGLRKSIAFPLCWRVAALGLGVLLSLPDAIITKAYAPILILGAVGGITIGIIVGKWSV